MWRDGVPVWLAGAKQKALLGLLAAHFGTVVSLDTLAEVIWGDAQPPTVLAVIQSHISRLRAVLDPGHHRGERGGLLEAAGSGYRLRSDAAGLDLLEYQGLAARAQEARRAGDGAAACVWYDKALAVWRGEPLADVSLLRGYPAVTGLRRQRAELLAEYAETASGLGWHDRVLAPLQALVQEDPLDERAHGCLMIALAGSGQQAAALEVYDQLRRRLDDQLGVLPGAYLASAHTRVLRQQVPAVAPDQAMPGQPATGPGRQLPGPGQLPPAVADFTGRAAELASLRQVLTAGGEQAGVPVMAVSGQPGVGKTALMVKAGHLTRSFFPDGQLWAHLDGATSHPRDPVDVIGEWLRALGVPGPAIPEGAAERAALFRSCLAGRRMLIALDDAESAAQVTPLLPGTAGCAVVLTSRSQLADLAGARLLRLEPLALSEATELLGRIAGEDRIAAEAQAAVDLAAGCGRLPLAVRIAGAKLAARPSVPISGLARAVAGERNRLDALQVGDLSVRASIASGYQALSEPARRAFRLLGLLWPGDFAEWVIAALLGQPDASAVVDELCGRSMLAVAGADQTGQPRFRLHDLLRDYAFERLAHEPGPDQAAARTRAQQSWLQLASLASAALPAEQFFPACTPAEPPAVITKAVALQLTADPMAWFAGERLNLLHVTEHACAGRELALAVRLAMCQAEDLHLQDRHDDAARMWALIADAAHEAGEAVVAARARYRLAAATVERGYADEAMTELDESVRVLERYEDPASLAYVLYWRSSCATDLGLFQAGRQDAERGLALARASGEQLAELVNLRALGLALAPLGRHGESVDATEQSLVIAERLDRDPYRFEALLTLAYVSTVAGDHERAIRLSQRACALGRRLGDIRGEAVSIGVMGDAYCGLGRYQEGVAAYLRALPALRDNFIRRHEGLCLLKLGSAYQALGDHESAVHYLSESLAVFRQLRLPLYEQRALQALRASPQPTSA